jgi:hypothetical protein
MKSLVKTSLKRKGKLTEFLAENVVAKTITGEKKQKFGNARSAITEHHSKWGRLWKIAILTFGHGCAPFFCPLILKRAIRLAK